MNVKSLATLLLLTLSFVSCDDNTDTIGSSLTNPMDLLNVKTDTFALTTQSIVSDSVLSRSTTGYLGRIKDPETGAYITGDFMVQFGITDNLEIPKADSICSRNESGEIIADSCEIRLFTSSFYGDSLAAMKCRVYEIGTPMSESVKYYSNYDPISDGIIRADGLCIDKTYTIADHNIKDSIRNTIKTHTIRIPMNKEYISKEGIHYQNYGTYLLQTYFQKPELFKDIYSFVHKVCPGFYIKTQEGIGSIAYIFNTQIIVHFRSLKNGAAKYNYASFGGTEEVIQATRISNDISKIKQLASDETCTYLKTPAGIFTEITLPVDEIVNNHENDTLNSAKIVLKRINNNTSNAFSLNKPTTLLMCERDSMYSFFENAHTIDNRQTYVNNEALTSTTSTNQYSFNNISMLIRQMADAKKAGLSKNPNWLEEHPNWNKVVLIPVTLTLNSLSAIVRVSHDMSLTSTRLVGGRNNPYDPIKISVIYSKFAEK